MFNFTHSLTASLTPHNSNSLMSFLPIYFFQQICQTAIHCLTQPQEPQIRVIKTKDNKMLWEVKNPITNHKVILNSEAEVYRWIEQHWHEVHIKQ